MKLKWNHVNVSLLVGQVPLVDRAPCLQCERPNATARGPLVAKLARGRAEQRWLAGWLAC